MTFEAIYSCPDCVVNADEFDLCFEHARLLDFVFSIDNEYDGEPLEEMTYYE